MMSVLVIRLQCICVYLYISMRLLCVPAAGWIKTFDRYYQDQTRHIFDTMLDKLEAYPKMRFIYAEMSFFSVWWNEISQDKKNRVKKSVSHPVVVFIHKNSKRTLTLCEINLFMLPDVGVVSIVPVLLTFQIIN